MSNSDKIHFLKAEISRLEEELLRKRAELLQLESENASLSVNQRILITNTSHSSDKIKLFRSLFKGRQDVFARRYESSKTGKAGYMPACANEWVRGICNKPKVKCSECSETKYVPFTDDIIKNHLLGMEQSGKGPRPFVAGIYPLLRDETCNFLAVDFDKQTWEQDACAFLDSCKKNEFPAYLERSRSGNGGHIWIFFQEPVPARAARSLGDALMTQAFNTRPEMDFNSFDRFFPSQDTLPKGGLGNLIALPLQKNAREKNHSMFIDPLTMQPFEDQWAFLSTIEKISRENLEVFVQNAIMRKELLPVSFDEIGDECDEPWKRRQKKTYPEVNTLLPEKIDIVLANQIFINSTGLPAQLRNQILRLASFSNPEFYRAQEMRLPTWGKPRILYCYEQFSSHIAIPVGCFDELNRLLEHYKIKAALKDERISGVPLQVEFSGKLRPEQANVAEALSSNDTGILSATTAFGKTVVALWIIAQRKVNTLILVHRTQLMEQWVTRISEFFDIQEKKVGRIGGGKKKRTGLIDVAVIQSVCRKGIVEDWVKEYGQVIVDECHHISAYSFEQVVRTCSAKFKLGLSATLTRKDGQHPIVLMNLGPFRYRVNAKKQAAERSFEHIIRVKNTNFEFDSLQIGRIEINEIFRKLYTDVNRNNLIISDIIDAFNSARQILVLSERTEHLELLNRMLQGKIGTLFVLRGGMGKKQVKSIMAELAAVDIHKGMVILATGRYLGEGFDLPNLNTLFLTFPISWQGTIAQYAGRLHRECEGKKDVIIYDYKDAQVGVLSRMHAKRMRGYFTLGYRVE